MILYWLNAISYSILHRGVLAHLLIKQNVCFANLVDLSVIPRIQDTSLLRPPLSVYSECVLAASKGNLTSRNECCVSVVS